MKKILLFCVISIFSFAILNAQNQSGKILKAGYGYYQGFNMGFNYFYKQNLDFGIGFGTHFNLPPLETPNHYNISIEHNFHFGQKTKQDLKPWIFNQQLMYWEQGPDSDRWRIVSLGLNIGRAFTITDKSGISVDIGPAFNLVVDIEREPMSEPSGWMWPVLPNGRLQAYYLF